MSMKALAAAIALVGAFIVGGGVANAQATRTWISGVGDDANPCSRTAPCKTFQGALPKTTAGGEMDCLDPGGFGTVTVTKSITLDCASGSGGQVGSILAVGTRGITIDAGATDAIIVRNLSINGDGGQGLSAIWFINGAALTIDNVNAFGFGSSPPTFPAIWFNPGTAGAKLVVHNSQITDNKGDGIVVQGQGGVATSAVIDHVTVTRSGANGIRAYDGSTVTVSNSVSSFNASKGAFADAISGGTVNLYLSHDVFSSNAGQGVSGLGATSTVTLTGDTIVGNGSVGVQAAGGATINSLSNNVVLGNTGTNATTTPITRY